MKLNMFRTVPLSIIRSLFTVHSAMVYVIQVCRQLSSRTILVLSVGDTLPHTVVGVSNEEFDHNALFHAPRYLLFAHHSSNSQTELNRF